MRINTALDIGDKIYRLNKEEKTIGFVLVENIYIEVTCNKPGNFLDSKIEKVIKYELSNGDTVLETDITKENNYYINIKSVGDALDALV